MNITKQVKVIISVLFFVIILLTMIMIISELNKPIQLGNDELLGRDFTTFIITIVGGTILMSEIDLFCNILYFMSNKKKKKINIVFNIIECMITFVMLVTYSISFLSTNSKIFYYVVESSVILITVYLLLRLVQLIVNLMIFAKKQMTRR